MNDTIEISAPCGKIIGDIRDGCARFLGIRYATAERFCAPVPVLEREEYRAQAYGDCCPQYRQFHDESKKKDTLWYDEFRKGLEFTYSEDCLNLNVYAPTNKTGCPVLLYLHGGSFIKGSNSERPFDGSGYASRGVVTVFPNYRLNVFGFCGEEISNPALRDIVAAIDWTKRNVAAFGGNPDNIVLCGQSAGAMLVQALILSEQRHKVTGAIMLSGGGLTRGIFAPTSKRLSKRFFRKVAEQLDKNSTENGTATNIAKTISASRKDSCFERAKTVPYEQLYAAWETVCRKHPIASLLANKPVYDDILVVKSAYRDIRAHAITPAIITTTKDDMQPRGYLFRSAVRYAKQSKASVQQYHFDRNLPGDDRGAWHSSDLWYFFGALKQSPRPFEQYDYQLSDKIMSTVCAFVRGVGVEALKD